MEQIMVIATLELSLMKTKKKLIEVILQHRPHKYQKSSFSSPVQFDSLSLHTQTLQNNWDKKGFFNDPELFARARLEKTETFGNANELFLWVQYISKHPIGLRM